MPTYPQRSQAARNAIFARRTFRTRGNLWAAPGSRSDVHAGRIHSWFRDALAAEIKAGGYITYTVFSYSTPIAAHVCTGSGALVWIVDTLSHSPSSSKALSQVTYALSGVSYLDAGADVKLYQALTDPQRRALIAVATGNPTAAKPATIVIRNLIAKDLVLWHGFQEVRPEWARKLVLTQAAARILRSCGFTVNTDQEG